MICWLLTVKVDSSVNIAADRQIMNADFWPVEDLAPEWASGHWLVEVSNIDVVLT